MTISKFFVDLDENGIDLEDNGVDLGDSGVDKTKHVSCCETFRVIIDEEVTIDTVYGPECGLSSGSALRTFGSRGLGVSTFLWGRVTDTHEKELSFTTRRSRADKLPGFREKGNNAIRAASACNRRRPIPWVFQGKYKKTRESNLDRVKKIFPCPKRARGHSVTSLRGKTVSPHAFPRTFGCKGSTLGQAWRVAGRARVGTGAARSSGAWSCAQAGADAGRRARTSTGRYAIVNERPDVHARACRGRARRTGAAHGRGDGRRRARESKRARGHTRTGVTERLDVRLVIGALFT
ncbi:hypothetical protein CRG98_014972 [Punica granatum]|uniref:Uncharacterized protein n=1 Tax=Punica granatum TaxID=22663 RepID=A0A2I0K7X2_PUNGR|nr:hypothetical protein CRG98_014972 [Punica granatum]